MFFVGVALKLAALVTSKKIVMFPSTMGNPEQYPCANLLNCLRSIGTIFITTEID